MATEESITTNTHHRSIPPIYLSYSNQTGFIERYFVVKLYEQLIANGLDEGIIWFDHHRGAHPDKVTKSIQIEFCFGISFIFSQLLGLRIVLKQLIYHLVVY